MKKLNPKKIINYDQKSDVLYIGVRRGVEEEFVEISPGINVELDLKGRVIGIEILNASKVLRPLARSFQKEIFEPVVKKIA